MINQLSDIAIVGIVDDASESEKSKRRPRIVVRALFRAFTINPIKDPRMLAFDRYMNSNRKQLLLEVIDKWAGIHESELRSPDQVVHAHQHLIAHMKLLSEDVRNHINDLFSQTLYAASIFMAFCALTMVGILSIFTNSLVSNAVPVLSNSVVVLLIAICYLSSLLSGYVLKRRFRHYCSQIVTLTIHAYIIEKGT